MILIAFSEGRAQSFPIDDISIENISKIKSLVESSIVCMVVKKLEDAEVLGIDTDIIVECEL